MRTMALEKLPFLFLGFYSLADIVEKAASLDMDPASIRQKKCPFRLAFDGREGSDPPPSG
jgi:hypothetical protein